MLTKEKAVLKKYSARLTSLMTGIIVTILGDSETAVREEEKKYMDFLISGDSEFVSSDKVKIYCSEDQILINDDAEPIAGKIRYSDGHFEYVAKLIIDKKFRF